MIAPSPGILRWLATLAVFAAIATTAAAKEYYVDARNGKDVATGGAKTAPWKTIQYAVQQAYSSTNAGDHTFHLATGGYKELVHFNYPAAKDYVATFLGASQFTVVIDGRFKMGPRMKGLSVSNVTCNTIDYDTWDPSASKSGSLTVSECQVLQLVKHHSRGSGPPAPTNIRDSIIKKIEFSFCCDAGIDGEITNCRIGQGGILHYGACQSFKVSRCYSTGPVVFRIYEGSDLTIEQSTFPTGGLKLDIDPPAATTVIVDDCVISGVTGPGLDVDARVAPGQRATVWIRDSAIYNCGQGIRMLSQFGQLRLARTWIADNRGAGVTVSGLFGTSIDLEGAVITRNAGHGLRIEEDAKGTISHSIRIASSIVTRNQRGISVVGRSGSAGKFLLTGCTIADNVIAGLEKSNIANANAVVDHSILAGKLPLGASPWKVTRCLSDTTLLSGTGNIAADPRFVGRAIGDYRLQPLSPAVDAGVIGSTGSDFEGDPRHVAIRTVFANRDIGADELSYAGTAHRFAAGASTWRMPRLAVTSTQAWKIGAISTLEVKGPQPSDLVLWLADMTEGPVFEIVPGIPIYLANPAWIVPAARKPGGDGTLTATVPNNPVLLGAGLIVQALAGGASGTAVSPMLRIAIGK